VRVYMPQLEHRLIIGVTLEGVVVTTMVAIFAANEPWTGCNFGKGDCPNPLPWVLSRHAGVLLGLLWMVAIGVFPPWLRARRFVAVAVMAGPVGTAIGMLLAKHLFPTAYAFVWTAPISDWVHLAFEATVACLLLIAGPGYVFARNGSEDTRGTISDDRPRPPDHPVPSSARSTQGDVPGRTSRRGD
jgi:hypothetical protein